VSEPQRIASRDNALLVRLRRLAQDATAYRRVGQAWLEGDHLCAAYVRHGRQAAQAVYTDEAWQQPSLRALAAGAQRVVLVPSALFAGISSLPSPAPMGFLVDLPAAAVLQPRAPTLVLDRVQDAGNVGSMLRSAAAFGVRQVIALKGTAALWSPKVLRAGVGAHFGLALFDGAEPALLEQLAVPLVATSPHAEHALPAAALPWPCAWLLGHEGQGVDPALQARCAHTVRIPQPGGEESLNVAAAAAVCLYESARRAAGQ
jgi:TrmH family RNA methyltransferase